MSRHGPRDPASTTAGTEEDPACRLAKLEEFAAAGKKILGIEYIGLDLLDECFDTLAGLDFEVLGYPADPDRLLDELVVY